jgi:pyruvate dehydrogenase E2 component (dihydrolipoamide acetyltransferase)
MLGLRLLQSSVRTFSVTSKRCLPPFKKLTLPALSPTMETGNIAEFSVAVGESFEEDDDIAQIETDKATVAWEIVGEEGIIAKIFHPVGSKNIKVGDVIAVYVEEAKDVAAFANVTLEEIMGGAAIAAAPAASAPAASSAPAVSPTSYPKHVVVPLPALSPTMETGNIASWNVKVGDEVEEADVVCEIETDKAVVGFESMDEGFVAKIIYGDGAQNIKVGEPVFILVEDAKDVAAFADYTVQAAGAPVATPVAAEIPAQVSAQVSAPVSAPVAAPAVVSAPMTQSGDRVKVSPLGKKLLADNQADASMMASNVSPTGPDGRFRELDVQKFIQKLKSGELQPIASAASTPTASTAVSSSPPAIQQVAAAAPPTNISAVKPASEWALLSKQTIPHYYLTVEINLAEIDTIANTLNSLQKDADISRQDFILKAVALACRDVPDANSEWLQDQNVMRQYMSVNIETENDAHIYDAGNSGLKAISNKSKDGSRDAGNPTMTVYSFIESSVDSASAIIKPGQACALTIGGARREIVPDHEGKPMLANVLSCTLSCDHRLVDGAVGAQWLKHFKGYLEAPVSMLL